ncbi:hypothetical protein CMK11_18730 [Candidatus Poribacteria bacterium]|nr:hypothetical protein [Candidatus Poribacteria bacterium]
MTPSTAQLISYIAPGAPATRRPATGSEPYVRPEVGFTPRWFHDALGVDFGERWHADPAHRRDAISAMAHELRRRFPRHAIGGVADPDHPVDLLTGAFGACVVPAIYGIPIRYARDMWPACEPQALTAEQTERLEPPDLDANPFFRDLMSQVEWVGAALGRIEGYLNWQGVLNTAYRLRGEAVFTDMTLTPKRAEHLFRCVAETMADAMRRLYAAQRDSGVDVRHVTISNCLVNLVSPGQYRDLLLPLDRWIGAGRPIGIHNCAWTADPYIEHYATIPAIAYIDMGMDSDLASARAAFPHARRAVMYPPTDVAAKSREEIGHDLARIADLYGPCDIVFADIESGVADARVTELFDLCEHVSGEHDAPRG